MWTPETRTRQDRDHLRYGSDLSDEEWRVLRHFCRLPPILVDVAFSRCAKC